MCSWRSALRSLLAFSSSFGRDPGLFFGAKDSPWSAFFTERLSEERLTSKVRAAWLLDMPRSTAETIFRLRSSE
jgi:hypothetical protein